MTHGRNSTAESRVPDSQVIIVPGNPDPSTIDSLVHLKNLATGDTLRKTLGAAYPQLARQLCVSPATLQSVTRSWMATIDGKVVGEVSGIPHREYAARQRASNKLIWQASRSAGIQFYTNSLRRWLSQTQLGPWESDQLYVESLAVTESARRQGIAARLLTHIQEIAREQSCRALCLNALTKNSAAVSLYEDKGFQIVARKGHRIKLLKVLT